MVWFYDFFAKDIRFNFQKKDRFYTCIGGFIALVLLILLILFFVLNVNDFLNKKKIQIYTELTPYNQSLTTILKAEHKNPEARISISQSEEMPKTYFFIAFYISSYDGFKTTQTPVDETMLKITKHQVLIDSSNKITTKEVGFVNCPETLGQTDLSVNKYLNISKAQCLEDSIELKGSAFKPDSAYFEIKIEKCSGTNCKSESEINNYLKDKQVVVFFENKNFKFTDFDDPIGNTLRSESLNFVSYENKHLVLEFSIDSIQSMYNFLPKSLYPNETVYNIANVNKVYTNSFNALNNQVAKVILTKSKNKIVYKRFVLDIIASIALIGGISSFVFFIGYIFVAKYTQYRACSESVDAFLNVKDQNCPLHNLTFDKFIKTEYNAQISELLKSQIFINLKENKLTVSNMKGDNQGDNVVDLNLSQQEKKIEVIKADHLFDWKIDSADISKDMVINESGVVNSEIDIEMVNLSVVKVEEHKGNESVSLSERSVNEVPEKNSNQVLAEQKKQDENWISKERIEAIYNVSTEYRNTKLKSLIASGTSLENYDFFRYITGEKEADKMKNLKYMMAFEVYKLICSKKIKYNFLSYLKDYYCSNIDEVLKKDELDKENVDKSVLFNIGYRHFKNKMNLSKVLTCIGNFNSLKSIVLDQHQETIFNTISSPTIKIDEKKTTSKAPKNIQMLFLNAIDEITADKQFSKSEKDFLTGLNLSKEVVDQMELLLMKQENSI